MAVLQLLNSLKLISRKIIWVDEKYFWSFEKGLLVPMPYIYWPIGLHLSKAKAIVLVRIISEVRVYILDVIRDRVQIAHLQLGLFPKLSVRKFAKLPSSRNQCTYVVLYKILDLLTHRNVYLKSKKENFRFVHWSNDFFSYFSALWLFWDLYSVKISGFFKHSDFTWNYFLPF